MQRLITAVLTAPLMQQGSRRCLWAKGYGPGVVGESSYRANLPLDGLRMIAYILPLSKRHE